MLRDVGAIWPLWFWQWLRRHDEINSNLDYYVQFCVDGARTLHASILTRLATWLPLRILLDWYHLEQKCKLQLSLALRGAKLRNAGCRGSADHWGHPMHGAHLRHTFTPSFLARR
ncbi:MAG: hypothetical protein M0Z36_03260 [Thermaerobacter sp.]|nr:hypothetical protein [Thermaerobacter sp.]